MNMIFEKIYQYFTILDGELLCKIIFGFLLLFIIIVLVFLFLFLLMIFLLVLSRVK